MRTVGLGSSGLMDSGRFGRIRTDSGKRADTLQALLTEVCQLRQSIEGMTAVSPRIQTALFGLQTQGSAMTRATQRWDSVRGRCAALDGERQRVTADIDRLERSLSTNSNKEFKDRLAELKSRLEVQTAEFRNCQVAESEASREARTEQAKLSNLQDRIMKLDKALDQFGSGTK